MKKETKRFVMFFAPGSFTADTWTKDVESSNPQDVEWPKNSYAFTMHEREDVVDGEKRYNGESKQVGPMYYHPDSKVETLAEVKLNRENSNILISNMENNGWDSVIFTRWDNWPQPYDAKKMTILDRAPSRLTAVA